MHGICPKLGCRVGAEIGWVGRLLEFAEKPSITNGKKHVALDITKKGMSIILAPTDLCHPLLTGNQENYWGGRCGLRNVFYGVDPEPGFSKGPQPPPGKNISD